MIVADDALLVVEKPAMVPTQASEHADDDMIARVRASRAEPYLGIVQRLERDASGVQVFTREKRFNAALAPQFERNTVGRTFVIAIDAWKRRETSGTSTSWLAPRGDGALAVVRRDAPKARRSELRWRVDAHQDDRAILTVVLVEGSLAFARAHLAAVLRPAVGDVSLGAAPSRAPLVHLATLELDHPVGGRRVRYESPRPAYFDRWLAGDPMPATANDWRERITDAARTRFALSRRAGLDAYRLANDAGDDTPGVTLDRYGDYALVQFYSPEAEAARDAVLEAVDSLGPAGVYAKYRPRQSNTLVDTRRDELAPAHALRGRDTPDDFSVTENGLAYRVRLGDGLSTGIFLDQRANRELVRSLARDARVLNLFAYTCPFTVAAVAGGAAHTVSVDVSARALADGRDNLVRNGIDDPSRHLFVSADVFGWIEGARARGDRFDLVLLDPPSYSTTKDGSRFSSESDYRALAAHALSIVAPGGRLLACSNHRGISHARFLRQITAALADANATAASLRQLPEPTDFPGAPGRESHLKSVLVELVR